MEVRDLAQWLRVISPVMRTGVWTPAPYNKSGIPTNAWNELGGLLGLFASNSDAQASAPGSASKEISGEW